MGGDRAGGETSSRAHRHAPSTSQHGVECQPEHEQDGATREISLHEEADYRDRVDCRDGQRDLDDPGPGLGAIEVERQVHGGILIPKRSRSLAALGMTGSLLPKRGMKKREGLSRGWKERKTEAGELSLPGFWCSKTGYAETFHVWTTSATRRSESMGVRGCWWWDSNPQGLSPGDVKGLCVY